MKTILGVVRASTEHQEVESQKKELKEYVISLGYDESDIEWIAVQGASARKANKEYLDMLQHIKDTIISHNTIKAVAFWHLNRLGRIDTYLVNMKQWFIDNHIQVYVKTPALTLLNDDGSVNAGAEIAWNVFAALVKHETIEMFEKMARGKRRNKEAGIYNGGAVLFGTMVDENRHIVPNVEEIDILYIIYNEYATKKYSTYQLAQEMRDRGITQRGKKITAQWVQRILTQVDFKSIVGDALYNKVQAIINAKGGGRKAKHINFGRGLVKCPCCGGNMFAEYDGYKCYNHYNQYKRDGSIECGNTAKIGRVLLDNLLFQIAMLKYVDFMIVEETASVAELKEQLTIKKQKMIEAQNRLDKIAQKQERIKTLYIDGDITKSTYNKQKEAVQGEAAALKTRLDVLKLECEKLDYNIGKLSNADDVDKAVEAGNNMETCTAEEANNIIHRFIKTVTFDKVSIKEFNISITDIQDITHQFKYYPFAKNGKVLLTTVNGVWTVYTLDKYFDKGKRVEKMIKISYNK